MKPRPASPHQRGHAASHPLHRSRPHPAPRIPMSGAQLPHFRATLNDLRNEHWTRPISPRRSGEGLSIAPYWSCTTDTHSEHRPRTPHTRNQVIMPTHPRKPTQHVQERDVYPRAIPIPHGPSVPEGWKATGYKLYQIPSQPPPYPHGPTSTRPSKSPTRPPLAHSTRIRLTSASSTPNTLLHALSPQFLVSLR